MDFDRRQPITAEFTPHSLVRVNAGNTTNVVEIMTPDGTKVRVLLGPNDMVCVRQSDRPIVVTLLGFGDRETAEALMEA